MSDDEFVWDPNHRDWENGYYKGNYFSLTAAKRNQP